MLLLNFICLAMALANAIQPSLGFAHPSACYHWLVWAHVAFGVLVLTQPISAMAQAKNRWLIILRVPPLPMGIRALNPPVVAVLAVLFIAFDQPSMAAAIPCQSIIMYLYRKRHDALVRFARQPVVEVVDVGSDQTSPAQISQ